MDSPDWAVMLEKEGTKKPYFVVVTKGSTDKLDLRLSEQGKIGCGRKHSPCFRVRNECRV